jgi:hypothetical protein
MSLATDLTFNLTSRLVTAPPRQTILTKVRLVKHHFIHEPAQQRFALRIDSGWVLPDLPIPI